MQKQLIQFRQLKQGAQKGRRTLITAQPCYDPIIRLRFVQLSLLQLHEPPPRSNSSLSIDNSP